MSQSPQKPFDLAQIPPNLLIHMASRITTRQVKCISGAAMKELDDEALDRFSRNLPWGSYGMLTRASICAPSLGVALKRWCRHHGLIADDVTLKLTVSDDTATP